MFNLKDFKQFVVTAFQMYSAGQKHGEDSNIPFHDSSSGKYLYLSSWLKKCHCYFSKLTVNESNVHNKRKISLLWSYLVDLLFTNNNALQKQIADSSIYLHWYCQILQQEGTGDRRE